MKKCFYVLASCFVFIALSAQVPQGVNYQAIARNAAGAPLPNANITVRFTILEGISPGIPQFQETHAATTNQFGLFTAKIGMGSVVTGNFSNIDWSTGN